MMTPEIRTMAFDKARQYLGPGRLCIRRHSVTPIGASGLIVVAIVARATPSPNYPRSTIVVFTLNQTLPTA